MVFVIAITLIILALIFLALRGIFGSVPDNWQWFSIILAGVGILMAIPGLLQIIWGGSKLKVDFERIVEEDKRALAVFLNNLPLKNRVLKKMGVRRDPIYSIEVQFRIQEYGSGLIIDPIRNAKIYSSDDQSDLGNYRITLPPTFSVGASFMLIMWDPVNNRAFIPPDRLRNILIISPGYYRAIISLIIDGEPVIYTRQFKIGENADDLIWVESN